MEGARRMVPLLWLAVGAGLAGAGAGAGSAPAPLRARSSFSVQSTVLLSEVAGAPRDVGYRLSGQLELQPLAGAHDDDLLLLAFRIRGMQLEVRGTHARAEWQPRGAPWGRGEGRGQGEGEGEWRATWRAGELAELWLPAAAPRDALNYMRALTSLFQFQISEGQRNETDISGECEVTYETLSPTVFRKTKRRCAFEAAAAAGGVRARRVARYTLTETRGALRDLHAEELLSLAAHHLPGDRGEGEGEERAGVKARSWHALELLASEPSAPGPAALEDPPPETLRPAALPLPLDEEDAGEDADDVESLVAVVSRHAAALAGEEAGEGGSLAAAAALAPLLRALGAASAGELQALLAQEDLQDLLPGLCRALGLAGTAAAWSAARALTVPAAPDAVESLALQYLAGLALAPRPHPAVVGDALALAEEARLPALAEAALLAGAAAAARAGEEVALRARERLARSLARARSPPARALLLVALGNLRVAETTPLLVAAAERGTGVEAEAALSALRGAALLPEQAERVLALAGNGSLGLPARALALELGVESACGGRARAVPLGLVRLARALRAQADEAAGELLRALWQWLETLEESEAVAALWRVMPRDLAAWDARAPPGTSSVLRRALGWRAGRARAELLSAQLASRALLRRGRVALRLPPARDLLAVELWTTGLDAVAGTSPSPPAPAQEGEEEGVGAGLRVAVGGVALRPLALFSGQAELLGHVWAGTGAAPTAVLRALVPAAPWRARVPLQAGAALALASEGAVSLALDAQGAVSLWRRTATARLALRAAAHARASAAVRVRGAELRAHATLGGEARMRIAAELDFYDEVALCVRTDVAPHHLERTGTLQSRCGPRAHRVRRSRAARWERAGRSLGLGRRNDAVCRARAATDAEGDL